MNQRSAVRVPRRVKALFGPPGAPAQTGFTQDISETGLFITASQLPRLGSTITVKLESGSAPPASVMGEVVRHVTVPPELRSVKRHGFGLRLLSDRGPVHALLGGANASAEPTLRFERPDDFRATRERELTRGGLTFRACRALNLDDRVRVLVTFAFAPGHVPVAGRVVHCRPEGSAWVAILVMDEPAAMLHALDAAAKGPR